MALLAKPNQATVGPTDEPSKGLPMVVVERRPLPSTTGPAPSRWPRVLRRVRYAPLVWLIFAAGAFVGLYVQPPGLQLFMRAVGLQPGGGTRNPIAVPAPKLPERNLAPTQRVVAALGRLTPENDVITIAPPFGAGDARIAALAVREGDRVEKGQVLATLDNEGPL